MAVWAAEGLCRHRRLSLLQDTSLTSHPDSHPHFYLSPHYDFITDLTAVSCLAVLNSLFLHYRKGKNSTALMLMRINISLRDLYIKELIGVFPNSLGVQ